MLASIDLDAVGGTLADRGWRGCAIARYPLAIAHAYELAAFALGRAPSSAFAARTLLRDADAEVLALLSAAPKANPLAMVDAVFGDLDRRKDQHLVQALDAYLQTGDAVTAAQLIHMHPQTLRYRLKRVTALTGLDPRHPWDRYLLHTAMVSL